MRSSSSEASAGTAESAGSAKLSGSAEGARSAKLSAVVEVDIQIHFVSPLVWLFLLLFMGKDGPDLKE